MSYTLDVWYYRDDDVARPANVPVAVTSSSELQELLEYLLTHEQPHPPQIVARERPRIGPYDEPDTLVKVAVAIPERQGALLFLSPQSWDPPADGDDSTGVYATRGDQPTLDSPTLYVDTDTKDAVSAGFGTADRPNPRGTGGVPSDRRTSDLCGLAGVGRFLSGEPAITTTAMAKPRRVNQAAMNRPGSAQPPIHLRNATESTAGDHPAGT